MNKTELINKICDELDNYYYGDIYLSDLKILDKISEYADQELTGCLIALQKDLDEIDSNADNWESESDKIVRNYAKEIAELYKE